MRVVLIPGLVVMTDGRCEGVIYSSLHGCLALIRGVLWVRTRPDPYSIWDCAQMHLGPEHVLHCMLRYT